jgi:hypothetical protein
MREQSDAAQLRLHSGEYNSTMIAMTAGVSAIEFLAVNIDKPF